MATRHQVPLHLMDLPSYQSHKTVRAAKIDRVEPPDLVLQASGRIKRVNLPLQWFVHHKPQAGGYIVIYDDHYVSYSPAKAFETGYTRIMTKEPIQLLCPKNVSPSQRKPASE